MENRALGLSRLRSGSGGAMLQFCRMERVLG